MESKRNNTNVLLFGLLFNVILTLGLLGFMCYSFHRLDSRLTAVEHDLLSTSRQQRLANRVHVDSTPLHFRQSRSGEKEAVVKRAVDAPSMCSKCSSVCGHPNNLTVETNKGRIVCVGEFPTFLAKPSPSVTVLEKENVTLPCKVAGFPQPVITWYKNDHVIQGEGRQVLEIIEILFEDRGNYTCTAENLLGTARLSFNVTVKVQTKFLTKPKGSITTYKNWDTTLKCDIFGYPFPVITWTRSLNKLPVNRYVIDGDTLTIKNTIEDDGGAYICQGANELGSVMAVTWVVVTNEVNPYIVSSPPSKIQVRNVGDYVKLHCSGSGLPLPDVEWLKDGRPVLSTTMRNGTDSIQSEVVIHRFRPSDSGIYKCRFYNDENGTAEASTTIRLVNCGNPGVPLNGQKIGSRHWTGKSVSFICHPGYRLIGPATRVCLPSGNWSGIQPSCLKTCPPLENLKNGFIHVQQYWEGKRVLFTCDPGYWLKGSSERHCQANGTWSGVQPSCIGAMIQSNSIQSRSYYFTHFSEIMQTVADSNLVWKLCYRASYHGWAASIFHSNCDGKRDTVTIIRKDRYVFGGYTDIPWASSGGYGLTSNAFIFSIHNKEGLKPFKSIVKDPSKAIYRDSGCGPTFGGGHQIKIADNANSNTNSYTNFGSYYSVPSGVQDKSTILAGDYHFSPDEVEVFYLG